MSWTRGPRRFVALSLLLAALIGVPIAFREHATADFLVRLNIVQLSQGARIDLQQIASSYDTVFWFDFAVSVLLAVIAIVIVRRPDPSWYGAGALVAGFTGGSALWHLLGHWSEVRGQQPVTGLAIALVAAAGMAVIGSIIGWMATAPAGPRPALNPPVPPSHQAG